ncbi:MAG: precorrin-6Y C5,15-methyltransferase (decarboxylating) subunit CbiT [Eubacteriales bacterium]|nr:precorrin-6Y C5,15-methyltransferase (decarboxylating) subunit CbiT [Eubacteriales bacterium]
MARHFTIVGAGMGAPEGLTGEAAAAIAAAGLVLAAPRLTRLRADAESCPFGEMPARALASDAETVALLVSGDAGFFSAAGMLRAALAPHGDVETVCGLSSLQYFCAKLGVAYDDVCVRSLHGRAGSLFGAVSYHQKVFALTGGTHTASAVCRALADAGLGGLTVHLGENLGAADERIVTDTAAALADTPCGALAVLLIENPAPADAREPVRDEMLTRGAVPMTKEEVRWVSAAKLAVRPRDTVWDVGAGTGAVALELARKACDGAVCAVERNAEAVALLRQNRQKLGGYNVQIVEGEAPGALEELPAPDAVFVGGSGGELRRILELVKRKNPAARVVVNAIALETLHEARTALIELGFAHVETVQLAASRGKAAGPYTLLTANNPVFILSGGGENGE